MLQLMVKLRCPRCFHVWIPRTDKPVKCPGCKQKSKVEWEVIR